MKALSKFLSVLTLALVAGSAMPAHALEVEYDYPDQASIDSRAVGAYHQFNLMPAPMMMAPKIAEVITFDTKSDKLSPANVAKVKHVAMMLKSPMFVGKKVVVNGYTDNVGKDAPNQRLSYHRALTVVHALVAQGVPAASLSAQGQGKANPVADNATPAGRAANRRVTFTVVCDPR